MKDLLFVDETPEIRETQLLAISMKMEEFEYKKKFSQEELYELKTKISQDLLLIEDKEQELSGIKAEFKETLEPLHREIKEFLQYVRDEYRDVFENCYLVLEDGIIGYYNKDGELVSEREMTDDERQLALKL